MNAVCPHCKIGLQVPITSAGEIVKCPGCLGDFVTPWPGMGIAMYWLHRAAMFILLYLVGAPVYVIWLFFVCNPWFWWVTYQRVINIGLKWQNVFFALIPGTVFFFGVVPPGSGKKTAKKTPKGKIGKAV